MGARLVSGVNGRVVAIANRGEIAVRIAVTCRRLGAIPVALLGDPDLEGFAARQIGRVERVGPAGSELDVDAVVAAARRAGAAFVHPGYGFLSERAAFAEACDAAGIVFIGPSAETLRLCGDKLATRAAAERADAPLLPGSPPLGDDPDGWLAAARLVGYPLLVKPAEAGGGRGLRRVATEAELVDAVAASRRESETSGAGTRVYLERELRGARHVEVQVAGDGTRAVSLGDRDCSLQRRAQKVIEEAPAPGLSPELRAALHEHARRIAEEVGLRGIATCEFLLGEDGTLAFLEVNPRIQVEHPVTELVTGIDLVALQLAIASGEGLPDGLATPEPRGHAVEARVYAEDPFNGFLPSVGTLSTVAWPAGPGLRVDAGYATGDVVPSAYDAMLAKVIAHGPDRAAALTALRDALTGVVIAGVATNLPWLLALLDLEETRASRMTIHLAGTVPAEVPDCRIAMLGAVAHTLTETTATDDPWAAIGPFRVSGAASLLVHGDGWEVRLTLERVGDAWRVGFEDNTVELRTWRGADGVWTIAAGDVVAKLGIAPRGGELEIAGHGGRWLVSTGARPTSSTRAGRAHAGDGTVRAPLPGKVLQIHVAEGDEVQAGQAVVTISAMKMEITCEAPLAGRVVAIPVTSGAQVEAMALLVRVEIEIVE